MKLKYVAPLLALSMAIGTAYAADTITVTIGSASPLSGPQASFGQDNANGVKMAIKDLNAENIVIGGKKVIWKADAQETRPTRNKPPPWRRSSSMKRSTASSVT